MCGSSFVLRDFVCCELRCGDVLSGPLKNRHKNLYVLYHILSFESVLGFTFCGKGKGLQRWVVRGILNSTGISSCANHEIVICGQPMGVPLEGVLPVSTTWRLYNLGLPPLSIPTGHF